MLYLFIEDCKQPEGYKVGLLVIIKVTGTRVFVFMFNNEHVL